MSIKLIAFDLDGVLVEDPGSWASVHKGLGTEAESLKHQKEFFEGRIDYDEWAKKDARLWDDVDVMAIEDILYQVPLMEGIEETLPILKKKYKLVILSGGLKILADRVGHRFNMDYIAANELLLENNKVKGIRQSVSFNDKGRLLRHVAMSFNIKASECAAVGDFLNDAPMFDASGLSVAFNPKSQELVKKANYTVYQKDLKKLLDIF